MSTKKHTTSTKNDSADKPANVRKAVGQWIYMASKGDNNPSENFLYTFLDNYPITF